MPELPEVETTRRGLRPWVEGRKIRRVEVRERRLRWPVPASLERELGGRSVLSLDRRAKYLLLRAESGTALLHLGMSGSLRVLPEPREPGPHDHVDLIFEEGHRVRLRDPRRFGCLLWTTRPDEHPLLTHLGPEPLGPGFASGHLYQRSRRRRAAIKTFLMDARVVVGVGNIYASEALYRAGVHPGRAAGRISRKRLDAVQDSIRAVLQGAIEAGGTTLRDFARSDGNPGGYSTSLDVYDRAGLPCHRCGTAIRRRIDAQRSTYWCPSCQT